MTFGSVCTGIGGFDLGFERAGLEAKWQVEIDPACRSLLRHKFEHTKIYEDFTDPVVQEQLESVDILCGGTPCQGFSIAGLRKGLTDERSNLCLQFCRIADRVGATIVVWENVPGVLSLADNAFGNFLAALVGADAALVHPKTGVLERFWKAGAEPRWDRDTGREFCRWPRAGMVVGPKRTATWRVLDAQYFGVAQRRERVFVIADSRGGCSREILFEPDLLRRNTPPRRGTGESVAATLGSSPAGSGPRTDLDRMTFVPEVAGTLSPGSNNGVGFSGQDAYADQLVATHQVANALQERGDKGADSDATQTFVIGFDQRKGEAQTDLAGTVRAHNRQTPGGNAGDQCVAFQPGYLTDGRGSGPGEIVPALKAESDGDTRQCVAFHTQQDPIPQEDLAPCVGSGGPNGNGNIGVTSGMRVRRLTPLECERVQGFPDGWTLRTEKRPQKDSPRYRQLGNAVTVTVAQWIGHRITKILKS